MDEGIIGIVFFITFFTALFGILYMFFTTRNRERMALIEKGADPSIFNVEKKPGNGTFVIKIGLLLGGAGLGILMGEILDSVTALNEEAAYFSMILLFSGAGLVLSYFVASRVQKKS